MHLQLEQMKKILSQILMKSHLQILAKKLVVISHAELILKLV